MSPEQRQQVMTLSDSGLGYKSIAKMLDLNKDTVKSAIRVYKLRKGLPSKVKVYRGKIKPRSKLEIVRYIKEHPFASRSNIIEALNLEVSPSSLSRYFDKYDIVRKKARRGPLVSATNRRERVRFAKQMLTKGSEYFRKICWSDETTVKAYPNGEITMYWDYEKAQERADIVSPHVQQGGLSLQFWGCMSYDAFGPLNGA
jgi:transposase